MYNFLWYLFYSIWTYAILTMYLVNLTLQALSLLAKHNL